MDEKDELSMDELVVRLAVRPGDEGKVADMVISEATRTAHVRPHVEFADKNDIYDPSATAKPQRVVDLRPTAGRS